jgi:hypothetical protein
MSEFRISSETGLTRERKPRLMKKKKKKMMMMMMTTTMMMMMMIKEISEVSAAVEIYIVVVKIMIMRLRCVITQFTA